MLIDTSLKVLDIKAEESKYRSTDRLIVFDDLEQAEVFGEFIGAQSIFETTTGFLVGVFGSFASDRGWTDLLLEAKKRFNLKYRLV